MADARTWMDLTVDDIAALDTGRCVAVLPVGAVEQHGPHLPLGTDSYIAEGIKKMRAVNIINNKDAATTTTILWRWMKGLKVCCVWMRVGYEGCGGN